MGRAGGGRGEEAFYSLTSRIQSARELVCLMFYIYRNDETGTALAELLKRKASEGVDVYLLYDHLGSFGTPRAFWNDLRASGVRVRAPP